MTSHQKHPAIRPLPALLGVALTALILVAAAASALAAEPPVGQVSLLIGQALVVHADGSREALRRGSAILVGDRIETAVNGHVHLRFIDAGAVSVRPESVLEIQAYHYDSARPQGNEVRLRLEQGTGRSISGAATDLDKTRFRLNTPIAAIGVRGTDFIVQSLQDEVRATVAQGSISVSPLGAGCSSAALGPCQGAQARVLSADMAGLMVQVRSGDAVARLTPVLNGLARSGHAAVAAGDPLLRDRATLGEAAAHTLALATTQPSLDPQIRNNDRAAAELLSIAPLGRFDKHEASQPDLKAQLVWGRWSFASSAADTISAPFAAARVGRTVTVGDGDAGLFRSGPAVSLADSGQGLAATRFDLRLSRAQADFAVGTRTEVASVDGGTLSLDLARRTFATALALSSASAGKAELRVAGQIQDSGIFLARDVDQRVAGAVTADGKEAGYLFERAAAGGVFRGKTLWGHGP